jgi:hypothetical protein
VVSAPSGSVHTVWNAGGEEEVHAPVEFRPALRTETVLETMTGLARDGKTNKVGFQRTRLGWPSSRTTTETRSTSLSHRSSSKG